MDTERVQAIAMNANKQGTIPDVFIRPEKEQPRLTTFKGPAPNIPVIDFSNEQKDIVRLIDNASTEYGLFQITNHGIPVEVIDKLQSVGKQFFALPEEEKELYAKEPNAKSIEGYGTKIQKEVEGKKAWADHLFHYIYPPSRINCKFWPNMPSYKEINEEYARYLKIVVDRLLVYLSLGLGLGENVLKDVVGGDEVEYLLKINYYPPCPRPDLALGVVPHTDMSALTVLIPNEVQGLQMLKDERWIEVQYIPNALIVHIGDQIEIVSNGKYKAVFHRATVDKDKTRISWPVFCEPPKEVVIGPLPQLITDANPPKYKAKKFKDYQYCKLNKIPQ